MTKILIFARDPGGANTLIPLIDLLRDKYEVVVYAKDVAVKWFERKKVMCYNLMDKVDEITYDTILQFLMDMNPQIIITGTSLDDYTERYMWKAAQSIGIKSYAIMDQWMNMGIRFSPYSYANANEYKTKKTHPYLPTCIFVMDEFAKRLLLEEGIDESQIEVTGQPHFETIYKDYQKADTVYNDKCNILFVSEPITEDYEKGKNTCDYWGYNEETIFDYLYKNLVKLMSLHNNKTRNGIRLIIKSHPREDIRHWEKIMSHNKYKNIELILNPPYDNFSLLKSVDFVCGMSSMLLLEAIICKKQIVSIMINLKRENPFVLARIGNCKSCYTESELYEKLKNLLEGGYEEINFHYINNAADNIAEYLKRRC